MLAKRFGFRDRDLGDDVQFIPFTAQTRMSGVDIHGDEIRKGAADTVTAWVRDRGGAVPPSLQEIVEGVSASEEPPSWWHESRDPRRDYLKDIVKGGIRERFEQLRAMESARS